MTIKQLFKELAYAFIIAIGIISFSIIGTWCYGKMYRGKYSYQMDCLREAELKYHACYSELVDEVQNYIDTSAPTSNLRGYAVVELCEKYNVDIIFVLAQGELESHFATKGIGGKLNNVFNVGVFDGSTAKTVKQKYQHKCPNESIEPYLKLLRNRYLVGKLETDLLNEYVDINGKRYATDQMYETKLTSKYNYICENTNIREIQDRLKNYAIKCVR